MNLIRIVNTPRRGIGKDNPRAPREHSQGEVLLDPDGHGALPQRGEGRELHPPLRRGRGHGGGTAASPSGGLGKEAIADVGIFLDLLEGWREEILGKKRISEKVRKLVDGVDYWGYLIEDNKQNDKVAKWKFHNVENFIQMIDRWEKDPDTHSPGLFGWLKPHLPHHPG